MAEEPTVIDTTVDGVVMVESRQLHPGAFWPVQAIQGAYRCPCPAGRRRGGCAHTRAAWRHTPLIASVPSGGEVDWDDLESRWFTPGGAA